MKNIRLKLMLLITFITFCFCEVFLGIKQVRGSSLDLKAIKLVGKDVQVTSKKDVQSGVDFIIGFMQKNQLKEISYDELKSKDKEVIDKIGKNTLGYLQNTIRNSKSIKIVYDNVQFSPALLNEFLNVLYTARYEKTYCHYDAVNTYEPYYSDAEYSDYKIERDDDMVKTDPHINILSSDGEILPSMFDVIFLEDYFLINYGFGSSRQGVGQRYFCNYYYASDKYKEFLYSLDGWKKEK